MSREILRYAAFKVGGQGGNPAGIVLDADEMSAAEMLAVAAEVGYSETAFLVPRSEKPGTHDVRYFAPAQEVPFCGHATIASGVALVQNGHWGWSSKFIWVGIATVVAGGTLGGIGLKGLAKKRIDALDASDTESAAAAERRAMPIELLLTAFVLVTVVAMVHKWGA